MAKIFLGFNFEDKEEIIKRYLEKHQDIKNVIIFYKDNASPIQIPNAEYVTYKNSIEYEYFYPLLQKIDNTYLLIYDEMMKVKKRNDLTYNCLHHYRNQTIYNIAFEFFPFIDEIADFMIIADFVSSHFRGRGFSFDILNDIDLHLKYNKFKFTFKEINLNDNELESYKKYRDSLFSNLGKKDPDTIPNALEIFVGKFKSIIESDKFYLARNKRLNKENIHTYKEYDATKKYILIDLPLDQSQVTNWLKTTNQLEIEFLKTNTTIDNYLYQQYLNFFNEVKDFYVEASLFKGKCS